MVNLFDSLPEVRREILLESKEFGDRAYFSDSEIGGASPKTPLPTFYRAVHIRWKLSCTWSSGKNRWIIIYC